MLTAANTVPKESGQLELECDNQLHLAAQHPVFDLHWSER